jgi:transposase
MASLRRKFSREFKVAAVMRLGAGVSLAEVARSLQVNANILYRWRCDFQNSPEHAFPGAGRRRGEASRLVELERKLGQQALEIDVLKQCLRRIAGHPQLSEFSAESPSDGAVGHGGQDEGSDEG